MNQAFQAKRIEYRSIEERDKYIRLHYKAAEILNSGGGLRVIVSPHTSLDSRISNFYGLSVEVENQIDSRIIPMSIFLAMWGNGPDPRKFANLKEMDMWFRRRLPLSYWGIQPSDWQMKLEGFIPNSKRILTEDDIFDVEEGHPVLLQVYIAEFPALYQDHIAFYSLPHAKYDINVPALINLSRRPHFYESRPQSGWIHASEIYPRFVPELLEHSKTWLQYIRFLSEKNKAIAQTA